MKFNFRSLTLGGSILAAAGLITTAQAGITETENLGSSWQGTPTYLVNTGANPSSFTVGENNYGGSGGSGGFGALSQSFTLNAGQAGTLASIQLYMSASSNIFNVSLFDLGAYPVSGYPAGSASYNPSALVNLLQTGASFTYAGTASGANVVQLTFTGLDASLILNAGELYVFQIDPTLSPATQTVWFRGNLGGPGQEYRMNGGTGVMGALNGATRDASFALTTAPVPEPSTFALLGSSLAGAFFMVRRSAKKS